MRISVSDLKPGDKVDYDYAIAMGQGGITVRNSPYSKGELIDKTGSIKYVWWDFDGSSHDGIVHVVGVVEVDKRDGLLQVKIKSVGTRTSAADTNHEFERVSHFNPEAMWEDVVQSILCMENPDIRAVAYDIFLNQKQYQTVFKNSPAATGVHHAFKHGLLEHTVQMAQMVDALFMLPFVKEALNKDLCMFGVLMHDFGKIFEYSMEAGFARTVQGLLVGHISMVSGMIYETCTRLNISEIIRDHLMHVVLAHHGKVEWGSPVPMCIPEAAMVHHVDHMHGDVFGFIQTIADTKGGNIAYRKVDPKSLVVKRFNDTLKEIEDGREGKDQK